MLNATQDFVNMLTEWTCLPGFEEGAAFVVVMLFLGALMDLPFAIREIIWHRETVRKCNLRREGKLIAPCHQKACPAHGACPHYKPRERWRFLSVFRQRK